MEAILAEFMTAVSELRTAATVSLHRTNRGDDNLLMTLAFICNSMGDSVTKCLSNKRIDQWRFTKQVDTLKLYSEELRKEEFEEIHVAIVKIDQIRRNKIAGHDFRPALEESS